MRTTGQKIDTLLKKGYQNKDIVKRGYSISTIKYRRAKMFSPNAYKKIIERIKRLKNKTKY